MNEETTITGARLEGADLKSVTLLDVPLTDVHFDRKTQFDRAGLRGVNASGANFHVMVCDGLDIRRAEFRNAQLEGAIFRNVRAGRRPRLSLRREDSPPTSSAG